VRFEHWDGLTPAERRGFPPLCPDLVVELASPCDEGPRGLTALRRKMANYQANGAQLGWLLIPHQQAVELWPAAGQGEPQRIEPATSLDAGSLFPGLQFELEDVWRGCRSNRGRNRVQGVTSFLKPGSTELLSLPLVAQQAAL
jgi:Uma2 family endonuclease